MILTRADNTLVRFNIRPMIETDSINNELVTFSNIIVRPDIVPVILFTNVTIALIIDVMVPLTKLFVDANVDVSVVRVEIKRLATFVRLASIAEKKLLDPNKFVKFLIAKLRPSIALFIISPILSGRFGNCPNVVCNWPSNGTKLFNIFCSWFIKVESKLGVLILY